MDRRWPQELLVGYQHLFRSTNWRVLLTVIVFLLLLGMASNALYELIASGLEHVLRGSHAAIHPAASAPAAASDSQGLSWARIGALAAIVACVAAVTLLVLFGARKAYVGQPQLFIHQMSRPFKEVRAVIVFLSPVREPLAPEFDIEVLKAFPELPPEATPEQEAACARLREKKPTWIMPLKGILAHQQTVQRVIVIPSCDSTDKLGRDVPGTHRDVAKLAEAVRHAVGAGCTVESLDGIKPPILGDGTAGVDYEDPEELNRVLQGLWQHLLKSNGANPDLRPENIVVDVTSGQKPPSIAGAISTFGVGRLFQYVSTQDYAVKLYDIRPLD